MKLQDVPHDVKENPVRSGSCFLSVTDMFELVRPFALVSPETTPSVTGPGKRGTGEETGHEDMREISILLALYSGCRYVNQGGAIIMIMMIAIERY